MGGIGSGATIKKTLASAKLSGEKRDKRRVKAANEPEPVGDVGQPPSYLGPMATEFWLENAPTLTRMGVLSRSDRAAYLTLCTLAEVMLEAYKESAKVPLSTLTHYRAMLAQFGMTPVSRGGVKLGDGKEKLDEYAFLD